MNDSSFRGVCLDLNIYEADPNVCIQKTALAVYHVSSEGSKADKPDKFADKPWITSEESFEVYLESVNSSSERICRSVRTGIALL